MEEGMNRQEAVRRATELVEQMSVEAVSYTHLHARFRFLCREAYGFKSHIPHDL